MRQSGIKISVRCKVKRQPDQKAGSCIQTRTAGNKKMDAERAESRLSGGYDRDLSGLGINGKAENADIHFRPYVFPMEAA